MDRDLYLEPTAVQLSSRMAFSLVSKLVHNIKDMPVPDPNTHAILDRQRLLQAREQVEAMVQKPELWIRATEHLCKQRIDLIGYRLWRFILTQRPLESMHPARRALS